MWGIFLGLGLLMFLAYKGMSIIWVAPLTALFVAVFSGLVVPEPVAPAQFPLEFLDHFVRVYMGGLNNLGGFAGFTRNWFPVFLLGAIFGKIMDETGAAKAVALAVVNLIGKKFAILAVVLSCAVLTYGGISLFVVVFAIYPLALAVFREANITRNLIPGAIALGAFTFTMTALPGSPQIQNIIPTRYFGTTAGAAPIMGFVGAIIMLVGGMLWLSYREKQYAKKGIGFTELSKSVEFSSTNLPNWGLALVPLVVVVLTLNAANIIGPANFRNLLGRGGFVIVEALVFGILTSLALFWKRIPSLVATLGAGAQGSIIAIINTSAAVGFGAVVQAVPGFKTLTDAVLGIGGNPLISQAIAVNVLAGATGSASGGMGIALEALGATYVELANAAGISLEAFHRIASMSSGGLDTLPHNGAVLTLLAVTSLTHKDSYIDIFMVASAIPLIAVVVGVIMGGLGLV